MYSVAPESMCSSSSLKPTAVQGLLVFQILDHLNCTNFTLLAEHSCTKGMITVNISNITGSVNKVSNCLYFYNNLNILQWHAQLYHHHIAYQLLLVSCSYLIDQRKHWVILVDSITSVISTTAIPFVPPSSFPPTGTSEVLGLPWCKIV